jgi:hypothetical protein
VEWIEARLEELTESSLSAILGLLLAFTYGFVIAHHEARKNATVSEANALTSVQRSNPTHQAWPI